MNDYIRIEVSSVPAYNFAQQQNRPELIRRFTVINDSDAELTDTELTISTDPSFTLPFLKHIDCLPAKSGVNLRDISVAADAGRLLELTEKVEAALTIRLAKDGEVLAERTAPITFLAFDQWQGITLFPEMTASFVTPNHPVISDILKEASQYLGEWTLNPSLDAYMAEDANRVLSQAAAVFSAIRKKGISYAVAPASFGTVGQRVRLVDAVLGQGLGNCLELTLLFVSCLEAMGLHPLVIFTQGHAFAGVWLEDEHTFPEAVLDDVSFLTKRLADGVNDIAVFECTFLTDGHRETFDDARRFAENALKDADSFECAADIARARMSGISPLPVRVLTENGWHIEGNGEADLDEASPEAPACSVTKIDLGASNADTPAGRLAQWERRLLDLGLRNSLINLRFTRTLMPLMVEGVDNLEDVLSKGGDFTLHPHPEDWDGRVTGLDFDNLHNLGNAAGLIASEFGNKRLRSFYSEAQFVSSVKELYRAAKTSVEENGANTLYLALGLMKWYENPRSTKPRYAPIILIPIEMVRRSAAQGYAIRLRDEEPQMNITLLEKLRQDFGIIVNGLDPLPLDDAGVDTRRVFTVLRNAIMAEKKWDVIESAVLGIFSFSQFVMWNDIRNRADDLKRNKVVSSLIDGKLTWEAEPMTLPDRVKEDGVYLPLSADASQLFAIEAANAGESFVLHGPPGTGKSQTITALIANALANGKSVLFVAEKMAALEVVQRRLEKLGLGAFCLELHSNKSRKRDVLDRLKLAMETTKTASPENYKQEAERIGRLRAELDEYSEALNRELPCGASVYELISRYEKYRDARDIPDFPADFPKEATLGSILEQTSALERLVAAARETGHPAGHPLSRVGCAGYSQKLKSEVVPSGVRYRAALSKLRETSERLTKALGMQESTEYGSFIYLESVAKLLKELAVCPREWFTRDDAEGYMASVREMASHFIKADAARKKLEASWKPSFLELDGEKLKSRLETAEGKWFLGRAIGVGGIKKELASHSVSGVNTKELGSDIDVLIEYRAQKAEAEGMFRDFGAGLDASMSAEKWAVTVDNSVTAGCFLVKRLDGELMAKDVRMAHGGDRTVLPELEAYLSARASLEAPMNEYYSLLDISPETDAPDWILSEFEMLSDIETNINALREWLAWTNAASEVRSLGLSSVVSAYASGLGHEDVLPAFHKAAYRSLAEDGIDASPVLNTFSGSVFNKKVEQFKKLDEELMELTKREIFCLLAAKLPNLTHEARQSSEIGILSRAIRSGARGMSLRSLFEQIPELLTRLAPCMLMSPMSAAQYLSPSRKPFDLVVFDEASQLPTCKAVGALARGENAVIVGDPKQMPPTSFFETVAENTEDLESILDDCLSLNMPETHLLWHYRSRHESLIAFSNSRFYGNKLFTFPSVNDNECKVSLVKVNGVFMRGKSRSNREEAEAVIRELKLRAHDPELKRSSVGIVTFNINQQNLIDDLLTDACQEDRELESWAYGGTEPLFIKNLENVQGDERDVILFSVGFGPDARGRVSMNFGPLNLDGGWRRLNVAVTRARCEMKIFSSITPEQIDLSRTGAEGVAALKGFLEYASTGRLSYDEDSVRRSQKHVSAVADSVCAFLNERGYKTDIMVGRSEYRIDVGVVDDLDPEKYRLGILLDGESYITARTTRDRELAQISVLKGLGWRILRVKAMDWWDNREKELNRILKALDEPDPAPETKRTDAPIQKAPPEEFPFEDSSPLETYRPAILPERNLPIDELRDVDIMDAVTQVVQQEAPILEHLLIKRVLTAFSVTRVTPKLKERTRTLIERLGFPTTNNALEPVIWRRDQSPDSYADFRSGGREPVDIPAVEAVNAVITAANEQISLSEDDLLREAASYLGFNRLTPALASLLGDALNTAALKGMIWRENGRCGSMA